MEKQRHELTTIPFGSPTPQKMDVMFVTMLVAAVLEVSRSPSHVPRSEGFRVFCSKHGRHFSRFLSSRLARWSHMVECQPRGAPKARAIRGVSVVGGWLSDNEVGTSKLGMKIVGGDFFFLGGGIKKNN